jgi:hypothetical protein
MIRNKRKLEKFYLKLMADEKLSYKEALAIYEQLYREAVSLGAVNSVNIWEGFEVDLRIAAALNRVGK